MYGEAKDMTIDNQVKIGIRLNRLVACIEVINGTNSIDNSNQEVTITSIQLFNGNKTSYLTPHFNKMCIRDRSSTVRSGSFLRNTSLSLELMALLSLGRTLLQISL